MNHRTRDPSPAPLFIAARGRFSQFHRNAWTSVLGKIGPSKLMRFSFIARTGREPIGAAEIEK